jgi:hypothetical protein
MKSNITKLTIFVVIMLNILGSLFVTSSISASNGNNNNSGNSNNNGNKITICHATSSSSNSYNRIVVSANATNGHFDNNGTPLSGHEDDLFFQGEVDCPSASATPTEAATPTPSGTSTPTSTPSSSPTATPCIVDGLCGQGGSSPTPTATASATASATPASSSSSSASSNNSDSSSNSPSQGSTGDVLGATTLAKTGTTEDLMTLMFCLGIVFIATSAIKYAQNKT